MLKLFVTKKFESDFKKVPIDVRFKTEITLNTIRQSPFNKALRIKKLKGLGKNFWRLRIDRNYRLIYSLRKNSIILHRIRHRKDIYRGI